MKRISILAAFTTCLSACVLPQPAIPSGPVPPTPPVPQVCTPVVGAYAGDVASDVKLADALVVLSTSDGLRFERRTDGAGHAPFVPVVAGRPPSLPTVRVTVTAPAGPLAGASVTLVGEAAPVVTGSDGAATFVLVPPGPRHVWVTADGYQPADSHLEIPDTGTLDAAVSLTVVPPPTPRQIRGRLQAQGRALTYPHALRFRWRGATAFRLLEQVAHGRESEARAFLTWAHATGFNVVRVLALASNMFVLTPADGRAAMPRLFELAHEADVYVHITALADTASYPGLDLGGQVAAVGTACAHSVACAMVEVANEPYHSTQASDVHDVANLRAWATRVPAGVLVALGPAASDESREMSSATAITVHLDRSRDPWNMVRRIRELETLSADTGRYVINSEPIGAGEVDEPGRRIADPSIHFAFGVLSRIFEVGSTFHCEGGLHARIPRPVQQAAAEAFIAGTRVVPDEAVLRFMNAGWPGSPIVKARLAEGPPRDTATVRAYSGLSSDAAGVLLLLGVRGDPGIEWGSGWQPGAMVADRPHIRVVQIRR